MAKNTHAQEAATGTSDSYTAEEATDPTLQLRNRPVLGGVDADDDVNRGAEPSVGNNSAASSESESRESESQTHNLPVVAREMENHSNQSGVESGTAHSVDGSTPVTQQQPSDDEAEEAPQNTPAKPARKAATGRKPVAPSRGRRGPAGAEDDDF